MTCTTPNPFLGHSAGILILRYLLGMTSNDLEILTGMQVELNMTKYMLNTRTALEVLLLSFWKELI